MHTYISDNGCSIIAFNSYILIELCNWNFGIAGKNPVKLRKDILIKNVTDKPYVQYFVTSESYANNEVTNSVRNE